LLSGIERFLTLQGFKFGYFDESFKWIYLKDKLRLFIL
jgi:hypothetical protein